MPVPKRKWSRSRSRSRQANKGLEAQPFTICAQSGSAVAPHTVCLKSGYYKGEKVLVTKFERTLKRDETRKNRMDKIQAKPAESINPEVAQAQQEVSQEQAAKAKKARKKVADQ